ncbi:MAG TPA: heat-inducible transcriptional repressor HrcA [Acidimicrobiia bacterium]|nr:heat-inducible transcriptional repressor HrcA [Acidimicrobiia bacterium]
MLEERRSDVLRALVEEHIRSGEPVSSRSILEYTAMSVSAATIRNDLAALEREGFVVQPHTSAGRIPTSRAYRYYVDHLSPGRLTTSNQARIVGFFSSVQLELSNLLKSTSQLLADVTHYPAVVVSPGATSEKVRALHLVPIGPEVVMIVVISERGRVYQQNFRTDRPTDLNRLAETESLVASAVIGQDLGSEPGDLFVNQPEMVRSLGEQVMAELARMAPGGGEVYVGGTWQMAEAWDNLTSVHRVLEVLEREAEVMKLLAQVSGLSIRIGDELGVSDDVDLAVVSATYDAGGSAGSVGVIGPMRMDYKTAISAVERVGRELEERIGP